MFRSAVLAVVLIAGCHYEDDYAHRPDLWPKQQFQVGDMVVTMVGGVRGQVVDARATTTLDRRRRWWNYTVRHQTVGMLTTTVVYEGFELRLEPTE